MKEQVLEQIKAQGIRSVKVTFPDLFGIARAKVVPARHFPHAIEHGVHFAIPTFSLDLAGNPAAGTGVAEEIGYADMTAIPDLSSFTVIPWEEDSAAVIADLYYQDEPLALAPRQILKRLVAEMNGRGYRAVVGSELEFYLLRQVNGEYHTYADKPSMVYTLNETIDRQRVSHQISAAIETMEYQVTSFCHEFFPGQYEINLDHGEALEVADRTFFFKQAVKEIAWQNDLLATFMARPRNDLGGSGFHIHLSLEDAENGQNLFDDPEGRHGLSKLAYQWTAGQLEHAAGTAAILAPTINSYKRYVPGAFAPFLVLWGLDNRTCYVRIPPERGGGARVENRMADGVANPYLAIAATLAAGLDGIERDLDPGPAYEGDSYEITDPGDIPVVPQYLHEAVEALQKDEYICGMLGPEFVRAFVAVKMLEVERFRAHVTDWEFNEYVFHL
ncbi:MAG: glutamine synthetase family protein [Anaerolineae bacterium]